MENINLIPEEEIKYQKKEQFIKQSTFVAFLLLGVSILATGLVFYKAYSLRQESEKYQSAIDDSRQRIKVLSSVEISARNLDARFRSLSAIYRSRIYYSRLLKELQNKIPSGLSISSASLVSGNKVTVNGLADNYLTIADFISRLSSEKSMFFDVSLNTVNLESTTNKAQFFITVSYRPEAFK